MKQTRFVDLEMLSVAYCNHIIQTNIMLKKMGNIHKSMFTPTGVPTDVAVVVLGLSVEAVL